MALKTLKISDFRCLAGTEVSLSEGDNYFFGPNGAGKTSILEAAYFLGRGRSFRTHQNARLIRDGAERFEIVGHVSWADIDVVLGVRGARGVTEVRVGGAPAASLAALAERLAVQVIDPEVHKLVEEGPGHRRRFLDWGVFHVKHGFLEAWRRHQRALRQRNAALRQSQPALRVASWDAELLAAAQQITAMRKEYSAELEARATEATLALLGAPLSLDYARGWPADQSLDEAMAASLARDRERGRTHLGPQRADLKIRLGGRAARDRVSRGQQKLLASALVLAQLDILRDHTGRSGVLLLDDPAAELDAGALERLLARISSMGVQRLVTGLDARGLAPEKGAARFSVDAGKVAEMI